MTELVKFCVELSEKVPVAVNCTFEPFAIEGFAGVTAIDTSVAELTVSKVDPLTLPKVAWIMLDPEAFAVATPTRVIVAAFVFWELQVTELVRFFVELSLKFPVAANDSVVPAATVGFAGVTEIELRVGAMECGVPAVQLARKISAQTESSSALHLELVRCRHTMLKPSSNCEIPALCAALHVLAQL